MCYQNNNVAGASNNRYNCNNLAGASDANFRIPVYSYIDSRDFCRAVNRCVANQLLAAEDENNRHGHCRCKRCREY